MEARGRQDGLHNIRTFQLYRRGCDPRQGAGDHWHWKLYFYGGLSYAQYHGAYL